jgi:hypothetical protein
MLLRLLASAVSLQLEQAFIRWHMASNYYRESMAVLHPVRRVQGERVNHRWMVGFLPNVVCIASITRLSQRY